MSSEYLDTENGEKFLPELVHRIWTMDQKRMEQFGLDLESRKIKNLISLKL